VGRVVTPSGLEELKLGRPPWPYFLSLTVRSERSGKDLPVYWFFFFLTCSGSLFYLFLFPLAIDAGPKNFFFAIFLQAPLPRAPLGTNPFSWSVKQAGFLFLWRTGKVGDEGFPFCPALSRTGTFTFSPSPFHYCRPNLVQTQVV